MKLTADSRITDTLSKGLILTVKPEANTVVSVAAEQAGSPLTKTNVSTETSFGPYNSDIEYAVNLLSGTAAEVVESKSAFFLVGRQPVLFSFRDFAPRLLASLVASSTAECTSGVVTVTATSHGIPASLFDGAEFYFPGSASLNAGWYAAFYRLSADQVTFSSPGAPNFTSESVNGGSAFTSEVTYFSEVLPPGLLDMGKILSCRIHRNCDAVAAAHVVQMKTDTSIIGRYASFGASPNGIFTLSCAVATSSILSGVAANEGSTAATVYNVSFSPSVENTISITGSLAAAGMYQRIAAAKLRIE